MKVIYITQRVDVLHGRNERRDALDQRWLMLLERLGVFPVILPNNLSHCRHLFALNPPDGILLTGGNSLVKYGGDAPERDLIEAYLLKQAISLNIPILGVCRGMQLICDHFNVLLRSVDDHVAVRQQLTFIESTKIGRILNGISTVNSYHTFGSFIADFNNRQLSVSAVAYDGVVMAVEHKYLPVYGVMWHSEREFPFCPLEAQLFAFAYDLPISNTQ